MDRDELKEKARDYLYYRPILEERSSQMADFALMVLKEIDGDDKIKAVDLSVSSTETNLTKSNS